MQMSLGCVFVLFRCGEHVEGEAVTAVAHFHLLYQQQQVLDLKSENRLQNYDLLLHSSLKDVWSNKKGKR